MIRDERLRINASNVVALRQEADSAGSAHLAYGGSDGHPPSMETEIALLKQRADQSDQRMARIEDKLDRIVDKLDGFGERLAGVATKATVWTALGTGAGIAVAIVALFVGILTYLQDQRIAARPEAPAPATQAPIILQLPPWPVPPAAPAAPPPPG
jgi:hypothetical protein